MQLPETNCARARESVSAQLDDELTEFEVDRLEAHLSVCPECSAWAEQVGDLTSRLRATGFEEPAVVSLSLSRRRRVRAAGPVALVAAAAASLVAVLGSAHSLTLGSSRPARSDNASPPASATPAVIGPENARLGLHSLAPRAPDLRRGGRFRAV